MPRVISFINMKGGVGKTTLTVNIAHTLASVHSKKVLLVDADPQFNASTYLMTDDEYLEHTQNRGKKTLLDVFLPRRHESISTTKGRKKTAKKPSLALTSCIFNAYSNADGVLDLIPSTLGLMEIHTSERGTENRLQNFLKQKAQGYDYVLIDCPPTISIFNQAAIIASDSYIVPVKPDPLSATGLPLLERWLEDTTETAGTEVEAIGIVFCMVRNPMPNTMERVMQDMRRERADDVFGESISQATALATSVEKHQPILEHAPNSKSATELLDITSEFLERLGDAP